MIGRHHNRLARNIEDVNGKVREIEFFNVILGERLQVNNPSNVSLIGKGALGHFQIAFHFVVENPVYCRASSKMWLGAGSAQKIDGASRISTVSSLAVYQS